MRTRYLPLLLVALACKKDAPTAVYQALPVERRSISVAVRAAGKPVAHFSSVFRIARGHGFDDPAGG